MRTPHDIQEALRKRWDRALPTWLAYPAAAAVSIPLHPPTASEVLADSAAVSSWIRTWQATPPPLGEHLRWETRRWAQLGPQRIPVRWEAEEAEVLSHCAGAATAQDWELLSERYEAAVSALTPWSSPVSDDVETSVPEAAIAAGPDPLRRRVAAAFNRVRSQWLRMPEVDADLAVRVATWVLEHPDSGLRIRQVPLPGMHTKWLKDHRGLVGRLVAAARADGSDDLGLAPAPTFHDLLVLDPALREAGPAAGSTPAETGPGPGPDPGSGSNPAPGPLPGATPGGTAPGFPRSSRIDLAELVTFELSPSVVIICENSETVQVLPDLPGAVALSGSGYAVPGLLEVPWVQSAPVLYWGDLDADGFRILDRARHHHPRVRSVLMDRATLEAHRALTVQVESRPVAETSQLTVHEKVLHDELSTTGERLEQERIELGFAVAALRAAAADTSA